MRIRLLRDSRIKHYAGEVVEASPAECDVLVSVGSAVIEAEAETPETPTAKAEIPEKRRGRKKN